MNYTKQFLVKPGSRVRLDDFDPGLSAKHQTKKSALKIVGKLQQQMDALQFQLYADGKRPLLIIMQAARCGRQGWCRPACARIDGPAGLPRHRFGCADRACA